MNATHQAYGMLGDVERSVFCSLSVFAGPFTLDDAVAVASDDIDELDAVDAVAHLVDRSLVVRGDSSPEYRLLETLRAYGRERLDVADEADQVGRRHAELMSRKAAQARADAAGPRENDVVAMLRAQIADYGSAVNWAAEQDDCATAVRIAEDLFVPVSLWGDNGDPGLWMCGLLDIDFSNPHIAAANRFMAATWHLFFGNDAHRAIALATEAVELDPACAMAHVMSTFGAMFVGRAQDAVLAGAAAQGLARDSSEEVFCFIALGNALLQAGEVDDASVAADAFITWAEDLRFPTAMGMAYHLKGRTLAEQDWVAAREYFERGLTVVRERIPGCWIVDTNLKREMIPLVYRTNPSDAVEWALDSLRESVRHNETGNLLSALAYTAVMLADGGLDEVAAEAIGAVGLVLLAPRDTAIYEQTKSSLEGRLGQRYEGLVAEGSRMPILRMAQTVIDALGSLRPHATS